MAAAICGRAQLAAPVAPGGPSSTVGTYSNSWSPSVEGAALNQVEPDVGISVVDPILAGRTGDDGEDDNLEAIHQFGGDQRSAQTHTAQRAYLGAAVLLHRSHGFHRISGDQSRVHPGQRLGQGRGKDHLRNTVELIDPVFAGRVGSAAQQSAGIGGPELH